MNARAAASAFAETRGPDVRSRREGVADSQLIGARRQLRRKGVVDVRRATKMRFADTRRLPRGQKGRKTSTGHGLIEVDVVKN